MFTISVFFCFFLLFLFYHLIISPLSPYYLPITSPTNLLNRCPGMMSATTKTMAVTSNCPGQRSPWKKRGMNDSRLAMMPHTVLGRKRRMTPVRKQPMLLSSAINEQKQYSNIPAIPMATAPMTQAQPMYIYICRMTFESSERCPVRS